MGNFNNDDVNNTTETAKSDIDAADRFNQELDQTTTGEATSQPTGTMGATAPKMKVIGFTDTGMTRIGRIGSDKYLAEAYKIVSEAIKNSPIRMNVIQVPKGGFTFAHIILAHEATNGNVYYKTILLRGDAVDIDKNIIDILDQNALNTKRNALVPSDTLDDIKMNHFREIVSQKYPGKKCVDMEAIIYHNADTDDEQVKLLSHYASGIVDILNRQTQVATGHARDVKVDDLYSGDSKPGMYVTYYANGQQTNDIEGRNSKADFRIESYTYLPQMFANSMYEAGNGIELEATSKLPFAITDGRVAISLQTTRNAHTGEMKTIGVPTVIIDSSASAANSLGYTLLSIANTAVMADTSRMHAMLIAKDVGPLNCILNMGGVHGQPGEKISLNDTAVTDEIKGKFLGDRFETNPEFALEIPMMGHSFTHDFAFVRATPGGCNYSNMIIAAAENLTGFECPHQSVITYMFYVLNGTFRFLNSADSEVRDLKEIDETFIARHSSNPELITAFNYATLNPRLRTGIYGQKPNIDALADIYYKLSAELGLEIIIKDKSARVGLDSDFVNWLVNAVKMDPKLQNSYRADARIEGGGTFERGLSQGGIMFDPMHATVNSVYGQYRPEQVNKGFAQPVYTRPRAY